MWITASLDSVQVYGRIYSGSLRAVLFANHFYTLISWQSVQLMQFLPVYYPCKHLFGILRLFICLHVNFIDCKYKIDFRHVYGLARYIYRCVYVPVRAVTLYFWFLSRFISSPDKYRLMPFELILGAIV